MTLSAKIKADIDSRFDTWERQLKDKTVSIDEIFEVIGNEFLNSVKNDEQDISQYRCDKLNYLEDLAMKIEEECIDAKELDEADEPFSMDVYADTDDDDDEDK